MNTPLRFGIVGCGDVVEHKSGPSIQRARGSAIAAVMRRDAEKARAYAERNGVPFWTGDADAVIGREDVDVVYVATPPDSHKDYTLRAAAAGKHVLVEKPMAMSAAEGQEMIEACDRAGVQLFVAYYRRFHPHVRKMRELLDAGTIGRPVQAFIDLASRVDYARGESWRLRPEIAGGGIVVDVVSHRLDAMIYLLGDVDAFSGSATTFDTDCPVEQGAVMSLRFASGALCAVTGDFYSGRNADRFDVFGARGALRSDPLDGHAFTVITPEGERRHAFEKFPAPHLGLIRHIERVLQGEEENQSSGRDALITERILDDVVRRDRE